MLQAIFYARFHPERGPSVIHQYPNNTIRSSDPASIPPLITWSEVSSYIIAPYDLCNSPLSICNNNHRILGYPVSLEHEDYDRNRFTFNVCLVLDESEDAKPWERIVEKIAKFCVGLEWDGCVLQHEEDVPGLKLAGEVGYPPVQKGKMYNLLERVFEDLNRFGETCIRVNDVKGNDDVYVLNLRLETEREFVKRAPEKVRSWDVPLLVRTLPDPGEWTWDLTLQRIFGFIDGIRHVKKIAELADVEVKLVKRGIKELVYHGRAVLLDVFHFQAIYTCTDEIVWFIEDEEMQDECRSYVAIEVEHGQQQQQQQQDSSSPESSGSGKSSLPSREHILQLYADLQPGLLLQDYCRTHSSQLANIDIRRLITFGILKGFLRRIHKYAFSSSHPLHLPQRSLSPVLSRRSAGTTNKSFRSGQTTRTRSGDEAVREFERAWRKAALTSGWATPPSGPHPSSLSKSQRSADQVRSEEDERLRSFLDGEHCLDAICVEMGLSEKKVLERLRGFGLGRGGDVVLFNR